MKNRKKLFLTYLIGIFISTNFSANLFAVDYEPNAIKDYPEQYRQFHKINLIAQSIFSSQMPQNIQLEIVATFEINAPIAAASLEDNLFTISILGGFSRSSYALPGSQLVALCHELGHLLGGYPQKISPEGELRWASAEGQADYFSGGKCLLDLIQNPYIYSIVKPYENNYIRYCSHFFKDAKVKQCSIALSLAENFSDIIDTPYDYKPSGISIFSQDNNQVEQTIRGNREYPSAQCRLDTIKAGLFKALSASGTLIEIENELTRRPRCWFKD